MTREEAINKWIIPAIKNTWNEKKCNEILKALQKEPCEDCISREAVMHILDEVGGDIDSPREAVVPIDYIADMVAELPPVTPQPKTNIKALGEDIRICQKSITDKKVLIGFNMAVALCNKYLAESEVQKNDESRRK